MKVRQRHSTLLFAPLLRPTQTLPSAMALCFTALAAFAQPANASQPRVLFDHIPVDTTFDEPPRARSSASAKLPKPWNARESERLVYVQITVDSTGAVSKASTVVPIAQELDSVIVRAARRWTFFPARKRGVPVSTRWGISVELLHPRSRELASPRDTLSIANATVSEGQNSEVRVRGSAHYDSVAQKYRYSYEVENRSADGARVAGFAMLGCAVEDVDAKHNTVRLELELNEVPQHWNSFVGCGSRRDVLGWIPTEPDSTGRLFARTIKPGGRLLPMRFFSKFPPGRVRWVAQTAKQDTFAVLWKPCGSSSTRTLEELPLSGMIVGPVDRRGTGQGR
jgi:TonB family protein